MNILDAILEERKEAREVNNAEPDVFDDIEKIMEPEIRDDVPGVEKALVFGNPVELSEKLDCFQGYDNPYNAFGTCGLVTIANIGVMAGMELTEPEVVKYAMENGLCDTAENGILGGGGTSIEQQTSILKHFGLESHCEPSYIADVNRLANVIEHGHGVLVALNSGLLQDRDWKIYDGNGDVYAGHAVCMTGTARDINTKELIGFYLCDSSAQRMDAGRIFVPVDDFKKCYTDAVRSYAVITDNPIR